MKGILEETEAPQSEPYLACIRNDGRGLDME